MRKLEFALDPRCQAEVAGDIARTPVIALTHTHFDGIERCPETVVLATANRDTHASLVAEAKRGNRSSLDQILRSRGDGGRIHIVIERVVGHDVDDTANGVESEEGSARTADDLDLADVGKFDGKWRAPRRVSVDISINLTAVYQHEKARRKSLIVAADGDIRLIVGPLQDVDTGNVPQHAGNIMRAAAADFVRGDERHAGGNIAGALGRAGNRGRDRFAEQALQCVIINGLRAGRRCQPGGGDLHHQCHRPTAPH